MATTPTNRSHQQSKKYITEPTQLIAGGVNRNVWLGSAVICFSDARRAYLTDIDGNSYIDYALGVGPTNLGHAHPGVNRAVASILAHGQMYAGQHAQELALAKLVRQCVLSAESVRFGSTGSEMG